MVRGIGLRQILLAAALAAELSVITALWLTLPQPHSRSVAGSVRCASGSPVVGVWVEGRSGGSWFAELNWSDPSRSVARYTYLLPSGGQYQVRVGCGGSSGDWGTTSYSPFVDDARRDFVCDDPSDRGRSGLCR
jgi:hypothetical protein